MKVANAVVTACPLKVADGVVSAVVTAPLLLQSSHDLSFHLKLPKWRN